MALSRAHGFKSLLLGPGACLLRFVRQSNGGAASNAAPQQGAPALDPYSEKLQEKGTKELEQLTGQHDATDDDWVDVSSSPVT